MMDNAQLAKASLNDIVFEGRNKTYGAFELRRIYGRNVTRAPERERADGRAALGRNQAAAPTAAI